MCYASPVLLPNSYTKALCQFRNEIMSGPSVEQSVAVIRVVKPRGSCPVIVMPSHYHQQAITSRKNPIYPVQVTLKYLHIYPPYDRYKKKSNQQNYYTVAPTPPYSPVTPKCQPFIPTWLPPLQRKRKSQQFSTILTLLLHRQIRIIPSSIPLVAVEAQITPPCEKPVQKSKVL